MATVAGCNQLCNAFGLDTISVGVTVASQDSGGIEIETRIWVEIE